MVTSNLKQALEEGWSDDEINSKLQPEWGRVRGLGFRVTSSNVRATTQSTILFSKLQADFRRLEEKHEQLVELIRSQQMPPSSLQIFNLKLSDFGLAKLVPTGDQSCIDEGDGNLWLLCT
ncbi:hypothetical protein Sjap_007745 [Stephania japonica]|uniref:Uncharacterized protein n=1 Tax=Stephania japonica TaxID=461633 RepID=A0AAP0JN65_9MAGN